MNSEKFDSIITSQVTQCVGTLKKKASEYATEDRLHNFKIAAHLQGIPPEQALAGMMAKHTVSIYDMCDSVGENHSVALWEEKITDSINYLLLLKALIIEREENEEV